MVGAEQFTTPVSRREADDLCRTAEHVSGTIDTELRSLTAGCVNGPSVPPWVGHLSVDVLTPRSDPSPEPGRSPSGTPASNVPSVVAQPRP